MQTQLGRYALATLAEKNASSAQVKAFAQTVATQSSQATEKLDAMAKQFGVAPAKAPSVRDSYHYSELSGLKGPSFDQQFVQEMKIDDEMVQGTDQTESQQGDNSTLKAMAKQRSTALDHEIQNLQQLKA